MNLADTHDLLTLIASVDNRKFGDDTVIAWFEILADLPTGDCRAAVRRHFATSDAYLMPVHVRRLATEIDHDRRRTTREEREAAEQRAIEADPARRDRSAEVQALLAELRDKLPTPPRDVLRRPEGAEWDRANARRLRAVPNPHYDPTIAPPPAEELTA